MIVKKAGIDIRRLQRLGRHCNSSSRLKFARSTMANGNQHRKFHSGPLNYFMSVQSAVANVAFRSATNSERSADHNQIVWQLQKRITRSALLSASGIYVTTEPWPERSVTCLARPRNALRCLHCWQPGEFPPVTSAIASLLDGDFR